jgi:hypothetical protein
MTVKGAFTVELSGPYEARAALLDAFAQDSIAARYKASPSPDLDEEAKGWIEARFHEGTDSPSVDFQRDCLDKAAQLSHIVDKRTGALVMKAFDVTEETLPDFARVIGVPADSLELREPPGLWDVPKA